MFEFQLPTRITFGCGSRKRMISVLEGHAWKKIAMVVDHALKEIDVVKQLMKDVESCAKLTILYCDVQEPTYDVLDKNRKVFEGKSLDAVLGMGGGSAMDMAKAMAVLMNNRESAIRYRGFDKITEPVLPVITIPTTAGTGSEITPNASFIDQDSKKKLGINGEEIRPRYAFLDPELTLSCPLRPTISAAVDSMVHATEAFVAKKSSVMAKLFACEGFKKVFQNLPRVTQNLTDLKSREQVMYGAFLSAVALMHSGTGPAAAMSYPLGVRFGVPHGIAGAIFLPHVMRMNAEAGAEEYCALYDAVAEVVTPLSACGKGIRLSEILLSQFELLSIPQDLQAFGFENSGIDLFVKDTLDLHQALDQNPVFFGEKEIRKILTALKVGESASVAALH